MNRTRLAVAALLVSTGLAPAAGLVPGSDHTVREEQSAADGSVVTGTDARRDRAETVYGYPAGDAARSQPRETIERAGRDTPAAASGRALVPGSDSF